MPKKSSLRINDGETNHEPYAMPLAEQVDIEIGANCIVSIIEPAVGPACAGLDSSGLSVTIGKESLVRFTSIRECAAHGKRDYASRFQLAAGASLEIFECRLGGGDINAVAQVDLLGIDAKVTVRSALFAAETDHLLSEININHFASRTTSRIITKGVLADRARIEYRGLVSINKETLGCVGEQYADALLLSADARADLMPNLKIDANDVRCGHGTAVSGMDEQKLYYLMSRGLSRAAAMEAATRGFMADVLSSLPEQEIDTVEKIITPRLQCALAVT